MRHRGHWRCGSEDQRQSFENHLHTAAELWTVTSPGRGVAQSEEDSLVPGQEEGNERTESILSYLQTGVTVGKKCQCVFLFCIYTQMTCYFVSSVLTAVTYKLQHPNSLTQQMLIFGFCEVQDFPGGREFSCNAGDQGLILRWGGSPWRREW